MSAPARPSEPQFIPVSTLVRTSVCPVRVYLERHEGIVEPPEYTIAKQVGYHLGSLALSDTPSVAESETVLSIGSPQDPAGHSDPLVEGIWEEIRIVRPDIDDSMKEYLERCIAACRGLAWEEPVAADVACANRKYGISGRIDWMFGRRPALGILRATRAPTYGVWKQDRIRAAAYLLAAEEMDQLKNGGETFPSEVRIAYIPSGIVRTVAPTASDRRRLLAALRKAEAIYRGETPQAPPDAPCDRCPKQDICTRGARDPQTLFDRFFRKK
ncbi:MAG: RecB family exonuclease [Methanomicrobiales archaeon 53_19]|uniref:PD-(D/E)XK nuclease family protein n=1 Tax=Methanocalculus sp. TaxID=2004547 RepID=UPI0007487B50|nr:PD-(D/E)XK nuclease family protein [Methanocalculus sp.]KUK68383.1 MAG: RecB family exonuclease [Methanocalculus sp. 52_23]KUL04623.1 MAG: RecB family exonuclease [Methanomicrobiales archaeon 53_19]HIJ06844.1 PD-(D/E)XK nuclease family protein [Methanocalculus sp.]